LLAETSERLLSLCFSFCLILFNSAKSCALVISPVLSLLTRRLISAVFSDIAAKFGVFQRKICKRLSQLNQKHSSTSLKYVNLILFEKANVYNPILRIHSIFILKKFLSSQTPLYTLNQAPSQIILKIHCLIQLEHLLILLLSLTCSFFLDHYISLQTLLTASFSTTRKWIVDTP